MGKAIKPKVNPKLQRLKRMSVYELDRVSKLTAIKAMTKAAKAVKMNLILKCTKRISTIKKGDGGKINENVESGSDDSSESGTDNFGKGSLAFEVERLRSLKAIDHISIGRLLAYERYPKLFCEDNNEEKERNDSNRNNGDIQLIKSHKKFMETTGKMDSEIILLQTQKEDQLRKQQNILNAQAVTKKPSKLGKTAAHNAIFLDSLNDESDSAGSDDDESDKSEDAEIQQRREQWKIEKAARNKQNRAANKKNRDREGDEKSSSTIQSGKQKTDLSAYMPIHERAKYRERVFGEKRPTKTNSQGLNRAERRKRDRDLHNNGTQSTDASRSIDNDKAMGETVIKADFKRKKMESFGVSISAPPNKINPSEQGQNHKDTFRKDNKDLSQYAVVGKEWKEVIYVHLRIISII